VRILLKNRDDKTNSRPPKALDENGRTAS